MQSWTETSTRSEWNRSCGYVLLRVMMGVNMLMHGVSRVLAGTGGFAATLDREFQTTLLPGVLVHLFALVLPWVEAATGLLILLGLFRRAALLLGGATLVVLTFGTTLRQDWPSAGLQLTYAVVYAALIAFPEYDRYALDFVLFRGDNGGLRAGRAAELP